MEYIICLYLTTVISKRYIIHDMSLKKYAFFCSQHFIYVLNYTNLQRILLTIFLNEWIYLLIFLQYKDQYIKNEE